MASSRAAGRPSRQTPDRAEMTFRRPDQDPARPVYVISVAASIVRVHPRTLRIYEEAGFICPARTPTNIRLYSENDVRRVMWIRHLTQNLGVNLAGVRVLFELEERLGTRILERLYSEADEAGHKPPTEAVDAGLDPTPERAPEAAPA
jgi:MerR family transcriptional regulator/heat shock protein HspR